MPKLKKRLKSLLVGTRKVPPWPPDLLGKAFKPNRISSNSCSSDITKTVLHVLGQSADALPLLKSTCNSVLAIWDIAERVKRCHLDAQEIAMRCCDVLDVIADSVKDLSAMSYGLQASIVKFNDLLHEIEAKLDVIQRRNWIKRFARLNRQEDSLNAFKHRLDEAYKDIVMAATLQTLSMQDASNEKSKHIQKMTENINVQVASINSKATLLISVVLF